MDPSLNPFSSPVNDDRGCRALTKEAVRRLSVFIRSHDDAKAAGGRTEKQKANELRVDVREIFVRIKNFTPDSALETRTLEKLNTVRTNIEHGLIDHGTFVFDEDDESDVDVEEAFNRLSTTNDKVPQKNAKRRSDSQRLRETNENIIRDRIPTVTPEPSTMTRPFPHILGSIENVPQRTGSKTGPDITISDNSHPKTRSYATRSDKTRSHKTSSSKSERTKDKNDVELRYLDDQMNIDAKIDSMKNKIAMEAGRVEAAKRTLAALEKREKFRAQTRRDESLARIDEMSDGGSSGGEESLPFQEHVESWLMEESLDPAREKVRTTDHRLGTDRQDTSQNVLAPMALNGPLAIGRSARSNVSAHFPDPASRPGFPCSRPDACEKPREQTNRLKPQIPVELASFFGSKDQCVPNSTRSQNHGEGGGGGGRPPPPPSSSSSINANTAPMDRFLQTQADAYEAQLTQIAQGLLVQNRPAVENRFSGKDNKIDFEGYLSRFEHITGMKGVTPEMAVLEIRQWFEGPAKVVVDQYCNESDPVEALKGIKRHLKAEFGRRNHSARQMLDEALMGPQVNIKDPKAFQAFIFELQRVYKRAIETNRQATFDTEQTVSMILSKKLPPLILRWAVELEKKESKALDEGKEPTEPTFEMFLKYLKTNSRVNFIRVSYEGTQPKNPTQTQNRTGGKTDARIAATGVATGAASTPAQPGKESSQGKNGFQKGGQAGKKPAPYLNKPQNEQDMAAVQKRKAPATQPGSDSKKCCICPCMSKHPLNSCPEFEVTVDRFSVCYKFGYCFNCLCHGHRASKCPSEAVCPKCGKRHHEMLHRDRPSGEASTADGQTEA